MNLRTTPGAGSLDSVVAQVADEFRERQNRGERPDPEQYAARYPRFATEIREVLAALRVIRPPGKSLAAPAPEQVAAVAASLRAEQRRRWQAGERVPAEDYLRRLPALRADPDTAVDLIYAEFLLREQHGEQPGVEEYLRRFPEYADTLRGQIELHRAFAPTLAEPVGDRPDSWREVVGYEILGELGRGGMGVVYKARHRTLNRVVALKVVLHAEHAQPEELRRFLHEAEAVARLQHPNVVQLFESGAHNGLPYFTLELVPGGSLADRLRERPLKPEEAARIVQQVTRGVQHAHENGIVHRDLKPANVLLAADGTPKVTDFGLARRVETGGGLTATGAVVGTPGYMAPEQAQGQGKSADARADVYALGAILYECLTGRPPFRAATAMDTLLQVLCEEPASVRDLQPNVPRDLETICHKCLQKEPHRRYGSAAELAEDLRRFHDGEPVRARPVGVLGRVARWARRRPAVALLLLLLVLTWLGGTVTLAWLWRREAHQAEVAAAAVRRMEASERSRDWWLQAVAKLDGQQRRSFRAFIGFVQSRPDVAEMAPLAAIAAFNQEHPDVPLPSAPFSQAGEAGTSTVGSFAPIMFGD